MKINKRRFANSPKKRANVLAVEQKMLEIHENDFCGDVFLNDFTQVKNPTLLENGLCLIDANYKWLQFYDDGSKVCLTAIYNEKNEIVEWYFDIAREIGKENGVPYEDDLYLDIALKPNGETVLLDEDELKEAFERMEMTKKEFDEAYEIVRNLMKRLQGNQDKVKDFTDKYLQKMLEMKLYKFCEYQDEDFEELQRIKKDCFKWYVEKIYGWNDKKQIEFSQNFIQEHREDIKVIVYANQKIGVFTNYINKDNESVIDLFYLDKKYQNRGIGTSILREQLKEDKRNGRNTILQVFKENKARFLYEKMGFEIYDETETHYKMRRNLKE